MKWGLSVELQKPDYQTRLEMLKARAFREGVKHQIPEDVLSYLAARIKSNFRELEGALISLLANATLAHKEITVKLAESITEKIVGEEQMIGEESYFVLDETKTLEKFKSYRKTHS